MIATREGNHVVNVWDDEFGTWYEDDNGDRYTEDVGPPTNWPGH